ncbi:glycosyltransferase, partial [Vibrio sp. FNV 38]|nr:glycosyltransferase [Vibrio sp. FNV 38]
MEFVFKADTIEELAEQIGIDPAALKETVDQYNGFCETGVDEEFGKDGSELEMIGEGECRSEIEEMRSRYGLEDILNIRDFIRPEEVRRKMLDADIYLMTSDHQEGWGAVVNEAMNAGCALAASTAAGSVPYP